MTGSEQHETPKKCGLFELLLFLVAIISGTACSICSKTMMELHGIGLDGNVEIFAKPIFQTFGMFVGMTFGLVMHWWVLYYKIPFPGYDHGTIESSTTANMISVGGGGTGTLNYGSVLETTINEKDGLLINQNRPLPNPTPTWMYYFLVIPSIFDLAATALCMMGLMYLDVSIYQLLRGSGIIFVALMKQHILGDRLYTFQWIGVFWNVMSVFVVGATAVLNSTQPDSSDATSGAAAADDGSPISSSLTASGQALLGVLLVMAGAFVQALQFVFEEKVMTLDDSAVPPLLLIGMEGLWGTVLCLFVVYPLAYFLPGSDYGSYEDPFNTYAMFMSSSTIQWAFVVYFFAIFAYNFFAVMVTFMLNSVWHAILDNFRPITVWGVDLFIYYVITSSGDFGEPWTAYSWLQLVGMGILLFGTAIYNAPNAGSIRLQGQWYATGFDLTNEYREIEVNMEEMELDQEWEQRKATFTKRHSSFAEQRSPHFSIHTQALRGLAAPKI